LPFQQLYRLLPYPTSEIPDEVAKLKRMTKIREFGSFVMNSLPKVPLYFDADSAVYSDQPVIKVKSPQPNGTNSPNMIGNTPRESPLLELPSPSKMDDGENYQEIEERLGLEELVDDVDDEVILFKPGEGNKHVEHEGDNYHSKSIIGSGRSTSSDKVGSSSPRANAHQPGFDLFGNGGNSNQSFFSFNNLFQPQPQQPQPQPQAQAPNSFFGNAFMNNYPSPNGTPTSHQQQNPYYQQTSPSFSNNENAFGNSYWSPTAPNSFFPSGQGDKTPYGLPNGQNPFLTPQSQAPSPQVVSPYGPTTTMAWLSPQMQQQQNETHPSPTHKLNELNTGNYQGHPPQQPQQHQQLPQHSPHHSVPPPPGFQPIGSATAQNLPFPFPGGSNQQPRYKTKNPFVS